MSDITDTLAVIAADLLESGERLLAAVRGRLDDPERDRGRAAEDYVGKIGAVLGPRIPPRPRPPDPETGLPSLPPLVALGLTHRRLLVFSRAPVTGRTRDFLGAVPRHRIRGIDAEPARGPFRRGRLIVYVGDGKALTVETVGQDDPIRFADVFAGG